MLQIDTKRLIGMEEDRACKLIVAAGGIANVTIRDFFPLVTNTDFRLDRINLEVKNGIVIKANVG